MEKILNKLIDKLDRKLSEERRDKPNDTTLSGRFMFGRHIIRFVFKPSGCEIEIYNPILDIFLDRVSFYCEPRVMGWNNVEIEGTDDWNEHGFRNESDYIKWKYK